MSRIFWSWVLSILVAIGWTTTALATEFETPEARLENLEREVEALKCRPQAAEVDFCNEPPQVTHEAGAELTLLRPQIGSLVLRDAIQDEFKVTPSYNLDAAFRVWLGRQSSNGLGWRVSYWKFDDSASVEFPQEFQSAILSSDLNLYTVDMELTRLGKICNWDIFSSIGVRIGGIDTEDMFRMSDTIASLNQHFTGAGLTFSLGTQQNLGNSNWSVYGSFRGSLLYGASNFNASADIHEFIDYTNSLSGTVVDQTVSILEMRLGLQYERCTQFGLFFTRLGVETQLWELPPIVAGIGDKNIGLLGPTFLVGLRR